ALVASMAHMQAGALPPGEGRDALVGFQRRVSAIAQVHRRLYTSEDVSHVALEQYLAGLVDELHQSLGGEGCTVERIRLAAEPATVPTDHAVSIGVIVSELVTNACKYAYRDLPPGDVDVVLRMAGAGEAELSVADRGAGLDASPAQGTGLGARVVQSMARALGGRLEHPPVERGTRAVLTFPVVADPDAAPAGGAA
ncbi:MAG: sensor histidine kinase, partial [Sphingomonadaceae bacterium]